MLRPSWSWKPSFYAWNNRKTLDDKMHKCVVRFDKRLFSFSKTKRENPAVSLRTNNERILFVGQALKVNDEGLSQEEFGYSIHVFRSEDLPEDPF